MRINKLLIATMLAMCVIGFCMGDVSAKDKDFHPDTSEGGDAGYNNWTVPIGNEWTINADHRRTICHNDFTLTDAEDGNHKIKLGKGKYTIDSSFKGKTLILHINWIGVPNDNLITIPIYPGGNIRLKASYGNAFYHQSWMDLSINGWHNNGLGASTKGVDIYSLPPEAWDF